MSTLEVAKAIRLSISSARISTYENAALAVGRGLDEAVTLYAWNALVSGHLTYTVFFQTWKNASLYLHTEQRSQLILSKSGCFEIELLIMSRSFHET
ncbi:hypothetical protein [Pseudomonas syringae]|uniref:hypothetical protein n=1 Tax=Pseudomonas syringae TaxID=317 RepID=UPI000467A3DF|nr:hypothetical protein [Pseudomonas syringae]